MQQIINVRFMEDGTVIIDYTEPGHPEFNEVRSIEITAQAQAHYNYLEKLVESIFSDCGEILDYIHRVKSGNIVI